ncbi:E3 ubiquitin-protein ligase TRAIP [Vipera latastei]
MAQFGVNQDNGSSYMSRNIQIGLMKTGSKVVIVKTVIHGTLVVHGGSLHFSCIGQLICDNTEYESLKESQKASNHKVEKLRKDLSYADHKLQKTVQELKKTEKLKNTKIVLRSADKEIMSLKNKIGVLQDTIKVPSLTSEAISGLSLKECRLRGR